MASPNSYQYPSSSAYQPQQATFDTREDFPGPRAGHTLTAISHRLFLFGGSSTVASNGADISFQGITNSVHCFSIFTRKWTRIHPEGIPPSPRAYHAAVACDDMVVIQGGIGPAGLCSGELIVLKTTNDQFRWQIVEIGGEAPGPRYGHVMAIADSTLLIYGGTNGNRILSDTWAFHAAKKPNFWEKLTPFGYRPKGIMYASASTRRQDRYFTLCGGRDCYGESLGDAYGLQKLNNGFWMWTRFPGVAHSRRYQHTAVFVGSRLHIIGGVHNGTRLIDGEAAIAVLDTETGEWLDRNGPVTSNLSSNGQYRYQLMRRCSHAAVAVGNRIFMHGGIREGVMLEDFLVAEISQPSSFETANASSRRRSSSQSSLDGSAEAHLNLPSLETAFYATAAEGFDPNVASSSERVGNQGGLVRQPRLDRAVQDLVKEVILTLLKPKEWEPPATREFFLSYAQVAGLCSVAKGIIEQEPTLLQLNAPIKIFGDLHGQFRDLMRLFSEYGSPSIKGDIAYIDYLFLGDYVDRGTHSLETIMLLIALKIEYPGNIHLIRGNHEAEVTNQNYGFKQECIQRMGEHNGSQAWSTINDLFDYLPLAALINKKILCMHGGIGSSVFTVEQIANIKRPVKPDDYHVPVVVKDLLWSDPTANDSVLGVGGNPRGDCIVSFGPDVVKAFCERNNLDMIIRAHECVLDGFERFAQGQLITVFSATNYCGVAQNAGAILVIGRDLLIVAKMIHPLPPPISPSESSPENAWMPLDSERPPTPVRGRPKPDVESGSTS
ncbi:serine/threonine-protein phosphatase BSU1 [Eutrema salsugineum]|uniref:serine/threonine-protein phosphatase BSU1 n=1 Tax=Eutrema salsugineum TaxID=72664 RepID=UPI000CED1B71|nr:serine/threonine-protein phosphatase BSU1 [Eutrema salsugineum]